MAMAVVDSMVFLFLLPVALFFNLAASQSTGYTNHTVGGSAGWFFNIKTQKASADYSAWAAKQTFNLGDTLGEFFFWYFWAPFWVIVVSGLMGLANLEFDSYYLIKLLSLLKNTEIKKL